MGAASPGSASAMKVSPGKTAVRQNAPTTASAVESVWRAAVCVPTASRGRTARFQPARKTVIITDAASVANACAMKDLLETLVKKEAVLTTVGTPGCVWTAAASVMKATLERIALKVRFTL